MAILTPERRQELETEVAKAEALALWSKGEVARLEKALEIAELALAAELWGLKIGTVVRPIDRKYHLRYYGWQDYGVNTAFRVAKIEVRGGLKPLVKGYRGRVNGQFSTNTLKLMNLADNWEIHPEQRGNV